MYTRKSLILLLLFTACGGNYFTASESIPESNASTCLRTLGWSDGWQRVRLPSGPMHTLEVQVKANLTPEKLTFECTQRRIRRDGSNEVWRFWPCTDPRPLEQINRAAKLCGK